MTWSVLSFLGEPWFVVPWYAIGLFGMSFVVYDMRTGNTALKPAMKWAWPIIVLFFSLIGLALYFATARPPGVDDLASEGDRATALDRYESVTWRRVNGAVIHCVAGDGLGILIAMVIARAAGLSFWQEFWFEYAVGFAMGWLIFQRKAMARLTRSLSAQLGMAFRAELFSMLTVMGGMGAVMTYVTPMVVTAQPKPFTFAFWGFAMLGLLVGYVFTYPMNWLLLTIGWKHGMGSMRTAKQHQLHSPVGKAGVAAAMVLLGCAALVLPAWLTEMRERLPAWGMPGALTPTVNGDPGAALFEGLRSSLAVAIAGLEVDWRKQAALAMDGALRAAEAGAHSAPGAFESSLEEVTDARVALQNGDRQAAILHLSMALAVLQPPDREHPKIVEVFRYRNARVINPEGSYIGQVRRVSGLMLEVGLGGWRNAFGFIDLGPRRTLTVPATSVAFGPANFIGGKLVAIPTERYSGVPAGTQPQQPGTQVPSMQTVKRGMQDREERAQPE